MYITELEIDNFKSFGKKTKIPFYEGFTVISGPNGSGKSNIIDSILFCLALSGARGLRAEKLTDLINLNSGRNTAEVSITFSDGTRIRRRIKRTKNGYYSYNYLDDRLCKQGDIVEFLSKIGVKAEGYNVVMQGDITRITEMRDIERRIIIDEIAGVAEFDKKRSQALGELEIVRERIEMEELLLHELDLRLKALQKEREQALVYRQWQDHLELYQGCLSVARLNEKKKEFTAVLTLRDDQKQKISVVRENLCSEVEQIHFIEEEIRGIDAGINAKSGPEYLALLSSLEEAKGAIRVAEQSIERFKAEKEQNLATLQLVYANRKRAETRVAECTKNIRELSIDRSNISMELASVRTEKELAETKLSKESADSEGAKEKLFELMSSLEELRKERADLQHEQDMLIEKMRMRSSETERLDKQMALLDEESREKKEQIAEYTALIQSNSEEKKILDQVLSRAEGALFKARSSQEDCRQKVQSIDRDIMRLEAQQHAAGGVGGQALEAILGMDGVYGTVAQLGKVSKKYATALDIAAGGRLRYVVCENDAVAAAGIRYLKENRLGRLTFLPLNKLKHQQLPPLRDPDVLDYAVNLLEYDPLFDPVFLQVFAATAVVKDLATARTMMGKYRMVTLEGDLLEKGGAMTGGAQKKKMAGFGVSSDAELECLYTERSGIEADLIELNQAVERYTKESEELRGKRRAIDEELSRYALLKDEYDRRIENLQDEKAGIKKYLENAERHVSGGGKTLGEIEADVESVQNTISSVEGEIETIQGRLKGTGIPELSVQLDRLRKDAADIEQRLRNKDADITDEQRDRQHFSGRVEDLNSEYDDLNRKNEKIEVDVATARETIDSATLTIGELEESQKMFSAELEGMRKERDACSEKIRDVEKHILEFKGDEERIALQISSLQERESALEIEIFTLEDGVGDVETDLTVEEIGKEIGRAERELKKIGAVNMLAIEEYERVNTKATERTERKDILSTERTKLIERIEHFEQLKYDTFIEAYRAIDVNFRKIFARLTEGTGQLVLENEEDPFSGGMTFAVEPRGKKVRLLNSLSGGEKSLTTLAFIFAIQQYMPAPFYALDEVDMMLDGSNVERIASMIKELSANAQSICVSLRKPTIDCANQILGVTARQDKSTYVTGVKKHAS